MKVKEEEIHTLLKWILRSLIIFIVSLIIYRFFYVDVIKAYFNYVYLIFFTIHLIMLRMGVKQSFISMSLVIGALFILTLQNLLAHSCIVDLLWLNIIPISAFLLLSLRQAMIISLVGLSSIFSIGFIDYEFRTFDEVKSAIEYYIYFTGLLYLFAKSRENAWTEVEKYTSGLEKEIEESLQKERIQNMTLIQINKELRESRENLKDFNQKLEQRVHEKTLALEWTNYSLQQHIKDLTQVNGSLKDAKGAALQAAQSRSNFISGISHELRTPLNAIINFTDQVIEDFDLMLIDPTLREETKEFLARVMVNSRHLLQLINELLEFTKAEAGKMKYDIQAHDLNAIIHNAYKNTYLLLEQDLDINFRLSTTEKAVIANVDERRFLQILLNLLSNAIKFTDKGWIEIRSSVQENKVIVEIEDTGRGIAKEQQTTIFDPFVQVNSTDQGTGLGLGLVKRMCDDMDISIYLDSIEHRGTTFRLELKTYGKKR